MAPSLQDCALAGTPPDAFIVDAHTHMGPYFNFAVPEDGSAAAMVRSMDRIGIDVSICSPHIAITSDYREGNRMVAEAAEQFPGRIVPFITVNPNYPRDETEAEIARWDAATGITAFKFHASLHGTDCLDEGYAPAYEYANEHAIPILSHSWSGEGGPPAVIGELAGRYPDIQFVNAHSASSWEAIDLACRLAEQCDRVHLDLTGSRLLYGGLERMVERVGAGRILWGTDSPFIDPRPGLGRMLCADVPDGDKRLMLGENARTLYGL